MNPTPSSAVRRLAAAGLACIALSVTTAVSAGVVLSTYSHLVAGPLDAVYRFSTSPFGFDPGTVPNAGIYSSARAVDNRRSRLPTGANGETVFQDLTNDSGFTTSSTAGQTALAHASLQVLPVPLLGPAVARAMASPYENHASASTVHQLSFWNSTPVVINGSIFEPTFFYLEHRRKAEAGSAWYETWTATDRAWVDISLALDGHLGFDSFCIGSCGVALPTGTDAFRSDNPFVSLDATFIVFDLDQLAYCEELDDCGQPDVGHPVPMSILSAHYHGDDGLPFDFMDERTLSFETTANHRYLVMGTLSLRAQNGDVIDFFNTMRVTDIDVAAGVLRSDATGRDLADLFGPDAGVVPSPATLWLLLLGGGAAAFTRRRPRRG